MIYPLVVRDGHKDELVNYLEVHGVETRDLLPLLNQPVYKKLFGNLIPQYPVAANLLRSGFYIGCHQYIDEAGADHVIDTLYNFYSRRRGN